MSSDHPFLKRIKDRGQTGHGTVSEARMGKSLAARLTPGSGALVGAKGDMRKVSPTLGRIMMEAKATRHGSLTLDLSWLVKVAIEALEAGATPALSISFTMPDGKGRPHGDWVMVKATAFKELIERDP